MLVFNDNISPFYILICSCTFLLCLNTLRLFFKYSGLLYCTLSNHDFSIVHTNGTFNIWSILLHQLNRCTTLVINQNPNTRAINTILRSTSTISSSLPALFPLGLRDQLDLWEVREFAIAHEGIDVEGGFLFGGNV